VTLKTAIGLLYFHTERPDIPRQVVIELLNQGLGFAVEDAKAVNGYFTMTLVENQSEYDMPAGVTKVNKVRLLDGATPKVTLTPTAMQDVVGKDSSGEVSAGVPSACSVGYMKAASGTTPPSMVLKFDKPPNWGSGTNSDIEVYGTRTWVFTEDESLELGLPRSLQDAGLWRACFMATKGTGFNALYVEARNVYLRSGAGNEPRVMAKPEYQYQAGESE
jgi:hypothetical protein